MLREGRNREVRRLWEAAGCTVSRLIRIRYGNIELGRRLFTGNWRPLTDDEQKTLMGLAGLSVLERPRLRRSGPGGPKKPWQPKSEGESRSGGGSKWGRGGRAR